MNPSLKKRHKSLMFFCVIALLAGILWAHNSRAASAPHFLVTWKAQSYVPPEFKGKALPVANSPIIASFEIIQDGKIVDISRETVYWYLGDQLIKSGVGIQSIFLRAPDFVGKGNVNLRIQLPNYKSARAAIKTVRIPVVTPEITIEQTSQKIAGFFSGNNFSLRAAPYFFNVTDPSALIYEWRVNGVAAAQEGDGATLAANLSRSAPGAAVDIALSAYNPSRPFESANQSLTLISQ